MDKQRNLVLWFIVNGTKKKKKRVRFSLDVVEKQTLIEKNERKTEFLFVKKITKYLKIVLENFTNKTGAIIYQNDIKFDDASSTTSSVSGLLTSPHPHPHPSPGFRFNIPQQKSQLDDLNSIVRNQGWFVQTFFEIFLKIFVFCF